MSFFDTIKDVALDIGKDVVKDVLTDKLHQATGGGPTTGNAAVSGGVNDVPASPVNTFQSTESVATTAPTMASTTKVFSDDALPEFYNPYLDEMAASGLEQISGQLGNLYSGAGQSGSARHGLALAETSGDFLTDLYSSNYQNYQNLVHQDYLNKSVVGQEQYQSGTEAVTGQTDQVVVEPNVAQTSGQGEWWHSGARKIGNTIIDQWFAE